MNDDEIEIVLPATSANLGPAFDSAAVAMRLYLHVTATNSDDFRIVAAGRDSGLCGQIRDNLILVTYQDVLAQLGRPSSPLLMNIRNEIPIGKGCGSSAAARLAGVLLANHFGRLGLTDQQVICEAAAREGHADNCAASWYGGVVLTCGGPQDLLVTKVSSKKGREWPLMLIVAPGTLPTHLSRQLVPEHHELRSLVANVQNAMLLVVAFQQGRAELLSRAMQDHVHQPYREAHCPLLPALQPMAGHNGVLGVVLSGAGPSVLLFLDDRVSPLDVHRDVCSRLENLDLPAEILMTSIETISVPRFVVSPRTG